MTLVAATAAAADSIDDVDRLRHIGIRVLFGAIRAPSTAGTFLRSFTHGHALRSHAVHRQLLEVLTRQAPLPPGADQIGLRRHCPTHKPTPARPTGHPPREDGRAGSGGRVKSEEPGYPALMLSYALEILAPGPERTDIMVSMLIAQGLHLAVDSPKHLLQARQAGGCGLLSPTANAGSSTTERAATSETVDLPRE